MRFPGPPGTASGWEPRRARTTCYGSGDDNGHHHNCPGLPTNGETVYGQLITYYGSATESNSYTFTAVHAAALTLSGQRLGVPGDTVKFNWTAVTGATGYSLRLGTTPGANNLFGSGEIAGRHSMTASGLPTNGETVYGAADYHTTAVLR